MLVIKCCDELRRTVKLWKADGKSVAIVPTMGALHKGHLSLVGKGQKIADKIIVSVFINPKQFNNPNDLQMYPRTDKADQLALSKLNVDAYFLPSISEVYPEGFSTTVTVSGVSEDLCGKGRPGHFDGVATIVTKLLCMSTTDFAIFGEKDWQQLQVVKAIVSDLNLPVEIVSGSTVRELDGLALSSRNSLLTKEQRKIAPALIKTMRDAVAEIQLGSKVTTTLKTAKLKLIEAGFTEVEYFEVRNSESLLEVRSIESEPTRLLAAATLGEVRLIDNIAV